MPFNFFQKFLNKKGSRGAGRADKRDFAVPAKHKQFSQKTEQSPEKESESKNISRGNAGVKSDAAFGAIIAPHVSEKASMSGKYIFKVFYSAKKPIVKKAIEEMYKVDVESVNMLKSRGGFKKAIVTLKRGQAINEF